MTKDKVLATVFLIREILDYLIPFIEKWRKRKKKKNN